MEELLLLQKNLKELETFLNKIKKATGRKSFPSLSKNENGTLFSSAGGDSLGGIFQEFAKSNNIKMMKSLLGTGSDQFQSGDTLNGYRFSQGQMFANFASLLTNAMNRYL